MSFSSLINAVSVAMEQRRVQHRLFVIETFLMVTLSERSEFSNISILFVTENLLAAIPYNYG
jgi:hypothetical protein